MFKKVIKKYQVNFRNGEKAPVDITDLISHKNNWRSNSNLFLDILEVAKKHLEEAEEIAWQISNARVWETEEKTDVEQEVTPENFKALREKVVSAMKQISTFYSKLRKVKEKLNLQ